MSKRNKVVYSNIQPNTKEAGIWVNTDDGNIKIEKVGVHVLHLKYSILTTIPTKDRISLFYPECT